MNIWCVRPEEITVDLVYTNPVTSEDHRFWIRVKKFLTVGEQRRIMTAGWKGIGSHGEGTGTEISIDWRTQTFARAEIYITDWSLMDTVDGREVKMPVKREVLETLSPDVYDVIEKALTAHVSAMEAEKKPPTGSDRPSATSA